MVATKKKSRHIQVRTVDTYSPGILVENSIQYLTNFATDTNEILISINGLILFDTIHLPSFLIRDMLLNDVLRDLDVN